MPSKNSTQVSQHETFQIQQEFQQWPFIPYGRWRSIEIGEYPLPVWTDLFWKIWDVILHCHRQIGYLQGRDYTLYRIQYLQWIRHIFINILISNVPQLSFTSVEFVINSYSLEFQTSSVIVAHLSSRQRLHSVSNSLFTVNLPHLKNPK
jgi:hypothetical protein